jgi:two-component system, OmpR family, sensor kinase
MSFRWKLILWNTLVVLGLLVIGGTILIWQTQRIFLQSIDRDLSQRLQRNPIYNDLASGRPVRFDRPPPSEPDGEFMPGGPPRLRPSLPERAVEDIQRPAPYDATGKPIFDNDTRILDPQAFQIRALREPRLVSINYRGVPTRVATVPVIRQGNVVGYIQAGHDLADFNRLRGTQTTVALLLIPFALLIAGAMGAFLADRALRPVKQVADAAERMTPQDLNTKIDVPGNDELARLASSFNTMLARLHGNFQEREKLIGELEASLERQRRFVADASHELRTPLARLRLVTSSALAQDSNPAELQRALQLADQAGISMTTLVEQLLALARLEGRVTTDDSCDLAEVIAEAAQPFGSQVTTDGIPSLVVQGRHHDLVRAVGNLLENAKRYSADGAPVRVSVTNQGGAVYLTVADQGVGIAAEHLARLGERFYRVDEARNRRDGGSGLGLSIVKSIVEGNGGKMLVTSELGRGTQVTLQLQAKSDAV